MQRQQKIEALLKDAFSPSYLEALNESHMHSVPPNSETHFKLVMASEAFSTLSKVKRHQQVYAVLQSVFDDGLHALALHLYTPQEWAEKQQQVPASPDCMGGSKSA